MTTEQITERVEQAVKQLYYSGEPTIELEEHGRRVVEPLYREAMAKGLEMAEAECEKRRMLCAAAAAAQPYAENGWREKKILLGYLSEWCCEQANALKEPL